MQPCSSRNSVPCHPSCCHVTPTPLLWNKFLIAGHLVTSALTGFCSIHPIKGERLLGKTLQLLFNKPTTVHAASERFFMNAAITNIPHEVLQPCLFIATIAAADIARCTKTEQWGVLAWFSALSKLTRFCQNERKRLCVVLLP